ncbi:MAG: cardiolipin synthase [Clostridia bacterium]|nr:cardiolipin synthase [Clostridia bacterium]
MAKKLSKRKRKWIERTVEHDRSYKALAYNRFFTCIIFVVLQLAALILLLTYLGTYGLVAQIVVGALALVFVVYLAGTQERKNTRMLWIILILAFPVVGVPLYFLYGNAKGSRFLNIAYTRASKELGALPVDDRAKESVSDRERGFLTVLEKLGYPAYTDGEVEYYSSGKALFAAMKEELKSAKKFIFLEYFIIAGGKMWDEIQKILLEKALEGVKIKIIYDDFGSIVGLPPKYDRYLEELHENIQCLAFNKVRPIFSAHYNHRDHRKILVVDGRVAFTGGVNIADEYIDEKKRFGHWKDTGIKVTGSGVATMTKTFLETWKAFKDKSLEAQNYLEPVKSEKTGALVLPYADSPLDSVSVGELVYCDMIARASNYLYIATPYLVLDETLRASIMEAAARGVDVRIYTPGIPDKKTVYRLTRANYPALLKAGVKIYEYTPGFLHAKSAVSDGRAVVGTINFDYRSLYLHFENAVYFSDEKAVAAVKADLEEIGQVCRERTLANTKRNLFGRMIDSVLRLFEPLL